MISSCDNYKQVPALYKTPHYGSVFNWCNEKCFTDYLKTKVSPLQYLLKTVGKT